MAQDWRKILDNFSGSNTQSSSSSSSSKSSATKSQSDDWRSTLDKFSGSKKTSNYYYNSARKADRATNRARKKKKDEEESSVASRVAARTTYGNKKKDEEERVGSSYLTGGSSTFSAPYAAALQSESEIAPVKSSKKDKEENERKWVQKGALKDGVNTGSVSKAILGTLSDVAEDVTTGFIGAGEAIIDGLARIAPDVSNANFYSMGIYDPETEKLHREMTEQSRKELNEFASKDLYDERAVARNILSNVGSAGYMSNIAESGRYATEEDWKLSREMQAESMKYMDTQMEADSVSGERLDATAESIGRNLATKVLGKIGVPWEATTALSVIGSETEAALAEGATDEEARLSAMISAGGEVLSEHLFGGMFGEVGLDDLLIKDFARKFPNKLARNLYKWGIKSSGEGLEEGFSWGIGTFGKWLTYADDKSLKELFTSEEAQDELVENIVSGMISGGMFNAADAVATNASGVDYASGLTQNEQKVVDKLYKDEIAKDDKLTQREKAKIYDRVIEDLEKGYISIDTIVETLGGEKYDQYKQAADWESSLQTEYDTLSKEYEDLGLKENPNLKDQSRYAELKEMLPGLKQKLDNVKATSTVGQMKAQLDKDVFDISKSDRLAMSFVENARSHQKYEADLSKYEGRARDVIKQVMESGLADNSNQSHEFWDMVANMAVDRDTNVSLVDNDQMMELVKKDIEASGKTFDPSKFKGKIVDGIITEDGIAINAKTKRAFNFVVGHEITHSLETAKNYGALQNILFKYAKDEYETRFKERAGQYEDIYSEDEYRAKIDKEVTADLVGDYIFTDKEFIKNLSTENRTVFQQVWDEIKHLSKLATAGSKQARELERVKKEFAKVWREGATAQKNTADSGAKYSLNIEHVDGTVDELADLRNLTDEQAIHYLESARAFELIDETYIPVRKELPQVIIDTLLQEDVHLDNRSLVMEVQKARRLMRPDKNHGGKKRGHSLSPRQIIDIINDIENPVKIFYQTNRVDRDSNPLPNNVAIFVKYSKNGINGFATVEFENPERTEAIGKEYGETEFYTVNTAFFPDTTRNGKPFNYMQELENNPDNIELGIIKRQPDDSANWEKHPSTTNGLPSFKASLSQIDENVNYSLPDYDSQIDDILLDDLELDLDLLLEDENVDWDKILGTKWISNMDSKAREEEIAPVYTEDVSNNNEEQIPNSPEDIKKMYQEAIDSGDMVAAQRLVDKVASMAGYTQKAYHGTGADFNSFSEDKISGRNVWGKGYYFGASKGLAEDYAYARKREGGNGKVVSAYLKMDNPFIPRESSLGTAEEIMDKWFPDMWKDTRELGIGYIEGKLRNDPHDLLQFIASKNGIEIRDVLSSYGYDSIKSYDELVVFSPEQIKSSDPITFDDDMNWIPLSERFKHDNPDIRKSISDVGQEHKRYGNWNVYAKDILLDKSEIAPTISETENVAPVGDVSVTTEPVEEEAPVTADDMQTVFPDDAIPVQEELEQLIYERDQIYGALEVAVERGTATEVGELAKEYEELNARIKALEGEETARTESITDADAPAEMDAPFYGESEDAPVDNPFEDRDWYKVGNQKVKAYMYENPEVKPFFQAEAQNLLGELSDTQKGERWYNDKLHYDSGGEQGFGGQKRLTSDSIATLLDDWGMSYADIEKGLNAIIEDNGAENIAAAKKIEFMLNDRLFNGYKNFYDNRYVQPNQDYIRLINEKQINAYSKETFDKFMANADDYAPTSEEFYAPMLNSDPRYEQSAPVYDLPGGQQTYIPTKATYDAMPTDDIAPLFDATGKKGVPDGQQAFMPEAGEEVKQTRKEYHQSIIDKIKSIFKGEGFDFDNVLKNAKDLSTLTTVDNTPQRVMEKSLGYKEGGILADITVNQVAQNESEGIKWINSYIDQIKQISKEYGIKPGSKESAAAQMFAEGFFVNENNEIIRYGEPELIQDFGDADVRRRIKALARDPRIRKIYDDTLTRINESRARNLYPEIPRLDNYFLHFRAMEDTFSTLGLPFNPNDIRAKDLPTDLNGVTADLKPGQPYFASANHRTGKRTSFDLLGGLERYLNSAKNQIFHIDDIQTLRALRNYIAETYGHASGLEDIDSMTDAEAEERIKQVYDSHLSTFAKFLNEEANILAGKTALIDRGLEGIIGRRGMTFLNTLKSQVGSNMVGGNVSSSLTNFMPVAQAFAKANKFDFTKAFAQTVANKLSGGRFDSFAEDSPVVIRRKGADRFAKTMWQKMADPGYVLMSAVDDISTEIVARTKYNELVRKGMDSQKAHFETDKWVSKLMGDRSLGQQPQLYNSKTLGILTQFQLEVRNQLDMEFYDTYQEAKASSEHIENALLRNARIAAKTASVLAQLTVAQHIYGKAFESIAGYNPAFDIIEVLATLFGYDDEEDSEDTALDNLAQALLVLAEDMPYTSIFTGGRVPISAAIPDVNAILNGEDEYGKEIGVLNAAWEQAKDIAPYYIMPTGYGQAKKTYQGLNMFSDEHPIAGSYTDAGNLRFPVEDTIGSRIKAGLFGQYASENARKYFDQEQRTLNPEQTEIFAGLDIPIEDYWEYRDNLYEFYDVKDKALEAAFADGATDEDKLKGWYVNAVYDELYDLYEQQQEIASGNSADKKSKLRELQTQMEQLIDKSQDAMDNIYVNGYYAEVGDKRYDYSDYNGSWYEIKGKYLKQEQNAVKRYGITPEDYWNNTDLYYYADKYFDDKYASNNREVIANIVFGGKRFAPYAAELGKIRGEDLDGDGKTDSGSKKDNIIDYINGLDLDDGEKIIMYRTMYSSKADKKAYNDIIIDYLNARPDISAQEMRTILEELDFKVDSKGYITW